MKKHHKQLKDLGMEDEFKHWLKNIRSKSTRIQVGSRVKLIEDFNINIKKGYEGTVTKIHPCSSDSNFDIVYTDIELEGRTTPCQIFRRRFEVI